MKQIPSHNATDPKAANSNAANPLAIEQTFKDFEVSWAGPGGPLGEFCFGSENGELLFTRDRLEVTRLELGQEFREAVNGVAFVDRTIAVSSRQQVLISPTVSTANGDEPKRLVVQAGAHSVIATAQGDFVAPLGRTGFLRVDAHSDGFQDFSGLRIRGSVVDFYKVIAHPIDKEPDVLVFAMRSNGIAVTSIQQNETVSTIQTASLPGFDVVDLCALNKGTVEPSVAALGRDGRVALFRNILHEGSQHWTLFPCAEGIAYRVFSALGHLMVLSSRGLYVYRDLVNQFWEQNCFDETFPLSRFFPMEAVDANLCGNRWLMVVLTDGIAQYDLLHPGLTFQVESVAERDRVRPNPNSIWTRQTNSMEQRKIA